MEFPPIPLPESGRWRHRAASGRELGSSPPGIPRPGQRCLRGLCVSPWLTRCCGSCLSLRARCPAAAQPLLGARLGNATILLPKKQNSRTALKLQAWQACSVGGVCCFFLLFFPCPVTVGTLLAFAVFQVIFLREEIKTKAFCRSCLFGCKTLLIGYNTVYEFSQMSKYWSWS